MYLRWSGGVYKVELACVQAKPGQSHPSIVVHIYIYIYM